MCVLQCVSYIGLSPPASLPKSFSFPLSSYLMFGSFIYVFTPSTLNPGPPPHFYLSLFLVAGSDLKDIQNNKNRYLIASENQRPGHFSTAPIGSLTASPSSGALCNQGGLQSVTSIQERIMSTPGGEEAIERLKVIGVNNTCAPTVVKM